MKKVKRTNDRVKSKLSRRLYIVSYMLLRKKFNTGTGAQKDTLEPWHENPEKSRFRGTAMKVDRRLASFGASEIRPLRARGVHSKPLWTAGWMLSVVS